MYGIKLIIQILVVVSGGLVALMSILLFLRLRWPAPALWFLKLYVSALSPLLALVGVLTTIIGLISGSVFISLIGIYDVLIFLIHIFRVTRPPDSTSNFEQTFGSNWENQIHTRQKNYFLPRRMIIRLPTVPNPRMEQNISFATVPGTDRKLLCDIWQPHSTITPSGLAFIYLHGAAWYMLDKDLGTRPFFNHLAAQGHLIVDVAYRLAPETDMMGMVNDVKRAIVWIKENATTYGVNPNRIVVSGGSSGGHLALLAAYTSSNPQFTPKELERKDISVCAAISLYGPADLEPMYYHLNQHLTTRSIPGRPKKAVPTQLPAWIIKKWGMNIIVLALTKALLMQGLLPLCWAGILISAPKPTPFSHLSLIHMRTVHPHY